MPPTAVHGGLEFKTYTIRRSDDRYEAYFAVRRPGMAGWLRQVKVINPGGFATHRDGLLAADWEARAWIDSRPDPG